MYVCGLFWMLRNLRGAGIRKFCRRERRRRFVTSNLISVVYHELGHAVIDTMQVPIFGQEEDAADVFSILLIDEIFEPESANIIAYDAAFGFQQRLQENTPAFWDARARRTAVLQFGLYLLWR